MATRFAPACPSFPHMLHGGDYNPDQWMSYPGVLEEDMRLMKLSRCNAMTTAIFAWTALEPTEGRYEFGWLDRVMDMVYENGGRVVLATPSGARPAWMSQKYPEVLRVQSNQVRIRHGGRHNHCYTSPTYRRAVAAINGALAQRYAGHPALILWHLSNEYGGECYCELCQQEFRVWLQKRYGSLDGLNEAWWTRFWSHTFDDWRQIEAPMPHGEGSMPGHHLDWRRFCTDRHVDFMRAETEPLRRYTPDTPVTTNLMGTYPGINYREMAKHLDVVSWDNYPLWHCRPDETENATWVSMVHSLNRGLKLGKPFLMMESTPSATNWMEFSKLKRPGMHLLSSLQAVAHGSDSVQYFQWRKGRGSAEQHHGAVVDHCGHENTRIFRDVTSVGEHLSKLDSVVGCSTPARVALIYDWEVRWAIDDCHAIARDRKDYDGTCRTHFQPFWKRGIDVDVIGMDDPVDQYRIVVAPMLYLVRPGFGEKIEAFVRAGGTFVATYWSGIVNESTLAFTTGFPGPLRSVLGIWSEEIDALHDHDTCGVTMNAGNTLGMAGSYEARTLCDLVHCEAATALAQYNAQFYAGRPALTVNKYGAGEAWYVAARTEDRFLDDLYGALLDRCAVPRALPGALPEGVTASVRTDGTNEFVFVMNFSEKAASVDLGTVTCHDMIGGGTVTGTLALNGYGCRILRRPAAR